MFENPKFLKDNPFKNIYKTGMFMRAFLFFIRYKVSYLIMYTFVQFSLRGWVCIER